MRLSDARGCVRGRARRRRAGGGVGCVGCAHGDVYVVAFSTQVQSEGRCGSRLAAAIVRRWLTASLAVHNARSVTRSAGARDDFVAAVSARLDKDPGSLTIRLQAKLRGDELQFAEFTSDTVGSVERVTRNGMRNADRVAHSLMQLTTDAAPSPTPPRARLNMGQIMAEAAAVVVLTSNVSVHDMARIATIPDDSASSSGGTVASSRP